VGIYNYDEVYAYFSENIFDGIERVMLDLKNDQKLETERFVMLKRNILIGFVMAVFAFAISGCVSTTRTVYATPTYSSAYSSSDDSDNSYAYPNSGSYYSSYPSSYANSYYRDRAMYGNGDRGYYAHNRYHENSRNYNRNNKDKSNRGLGKDRRNHNADLKKDRTKSNNSLVNRGFGKDRANTNNSIVNRALERPNGRPVNIVKTSKNVNKSYYRIGANTNKNRMNSSAVIGKNRPGKTIHKPISKNTVKNNSSKLRRVVSARSEK